MERKKSCGAIIFRNLKEKGQANHSKIEVLLIRYGYHHWGFPKGHVEGEETDEETALREIKEETGVDVILDTNFRKITYYKTKKGVVKRNVFFVAEPKYLNSIPMPQLSEVTAAQWWDAYNVKELITFPGDYELYLEALIFWKAKHNL